MNKLKHNNLFNKCLGQHLINKEEYLNKNPYEKNFKNNTTVKDTNSSRNLIAIPSTVDTTINSLLTSASIKIKDKKHQDKRKSVHISQIQMKTDFNRINNIPENEQNLFLYEILYQPNKCELKNLNEYLLNIQKKFNKEVNIFNNTEKDKKNNDIINLVKLLEHLISRYSLIIFYLLKKKKMKSSKELFLLMLKENIEHMEFFELKIFSKSFYISQKKDFNELSLSLLKIYSFIIKYSYFFSTMKYRMIFTSHFLAIQSFIYKSISAKLELSNGTFSSKKNYIPDLKILNFYYSSCLHHIIYFSLVNYTPIPTLISLSENIINLYKNSDNNENLLNTEEESFLIRNKFNYCLFLSEEGKIVSAIYSLEKLKDDIIELIDEDNQKTKFMNSYKISAYKNFTKQKTKIYATSTGKIKNTKVVFLINNNSETKSSSKKRKGRRSALIHQSATKNIIVNLINEQRSKIPFNDFFTQFKNKLNGYIQNNTIQMIKTERKTVKSNITLGFKILNQIICNDDIKKNYNIDFAKSLFQFNLNTVKNLFETNHPTDFKKFKILVNIYLLIAQNYFNKKNYEEAREIIFEAIYTILFYKTNNNNCCNKLLSYSSNNFKSEINFIFEYLQIIKDTNDNNKVRKTLYLPRYNFDNIENDNDSIMKDEKINSFNKITLNNESINEFNKFFIFLNNLSLYQIKILNETQPKNEVSNSLPIIFTDQFLNCLTTSQKKNMENLNETELYRYIILKDPNKLILPNNLNFKLFYDKKQKNFKNNDTKLKTKKHIENDKEDDILKEIINSQKTDKIKNLIFNNYDIFKKLIKNLSENEINAIINSPGIIASCIGKYKNKEKPNLKKERKKSLVNNKTAINLLNKNELLENSYESSICINSQESSFWELNESVEKNVEYL